MLIENRKCILGKLQRSDIEDLNNYRSAWNNFFHADLKRKNTLIQYVRSAEFFCANLRETLVAFNPKTFEVLETAKVSRPSFEVFFKPRRILFKIHNPLFLTSKDLN